MKSISFRLAFITTLSFATSLLAGPCSLVPNASNELLISSYADLQTFSGAACDLSRSYRLTKDIDASASANLGNDGFRPVGSTGNPFTGQFHGAGFVISHLTIHLPGVDSVGLFASISGASALVDSLGLNGATITGKDSVGILAGSIDGNAKVSDVFSTGFVTGEHYVGGLIGASHDFTMDCSYSTSLVTAGNDPSAYVDAGGLIGSAFGTHILNSYSTGWINGSHYIGGLIGFGFDVYITNSYSSAKVNSSSPRDIGGILGSFEGELDPIQLYRNLDMVAISGDPSGTGLNPMEMKAQSSYFEAGNSKKNWDFVNTWNISENKSFPYLKYLPVAPFNSSEYLQSNTSIPTSAFLANDIAIGGENLIFQSIEIKRGGSFVSGNYTFPAASVNGFLDTVIYRVGIIHTTPYTDTLWGNPAAAYIIKGACTLTGNGTDANPYLVTSYDDLKKVGIASNSSVCPLFSVYRQTKNIDASASSTENGDGNPIVYAGFTPIGTLNNPFVGKYHGAGHVISNLFIKQSTLTEVGLFGSLSFSTGLIDSLGVADGDITATAFLSYAGSLVAFAKNSTIAQCFATGSVDGFSAGGLVGATGYTKLTDTYFTGDVLSQSISGGLIGGAAMTVVQNSFASANVTGMDNSIGGLFGYSTGLTPGSSGLAPIQSFWNNTLTTTSNTVGTALTTTDMQKQTSFVNWDFTNTWFMYPGKTYPMLRAFMTPLTVSAKAVTKTYDGKAFTTPSIAYDIATVDSKWISGTPTFTGTGIGAINAGTYTLSASGTQYSSQLGYLIQYQSTPSTLQVNKAPLTITVKDASKVVGAADPTFTYTSPALVNGEKLVDVLKNPKITREAGTTAGTYKINLTATADNYALTIKAGTLTITKASGVIAHNDRPEFTGMAQASIMDMQGRLAWSGDLYVNGGHFSLPSIGAGQWVVKLRMGNDVVVETKIVE